MATTAQAGAAGASGNKRHFALAAVALVGIAAAVAAIFGTHGSAWGNKVCSVGVGRMYVLEGARACGCVAGEGWVVN